MISIIFNGVVQFVGSVVDRFADRSVDRFADIFDDCYGFAVLSNGVQ